MPNFINWPCPSCGAALDVAEEVSRVTCATCGTEHVVHRIGSRVSLKTIRDSTKKQEVGFDKTASDSALEKLKEELKKSE